MAEPAKKLNEDSTPEENIRPNLGVIRGGGESTPRLGNLFLVPNSPDDAEGSQDGESPGRHLSLVKPKMNTKDDTPSGEAENTAGSVQAGLQSALNGPEKALSSDVIGKTNITPAAMIAGKGGKFKTIVGRLDRKKSAVGLGIGSIVGVFFFIMLSAAPLKLLHIGTWMERLHFTNNSEFMDGRGSRFYRYMRTGNIQETRLGRVGAKYAKKWELQLVDNTGLRPIYHPTTRYLLSYEVVDAEKAAPWLAEMEKDGINTNARLDVDAVYSSSDGNGLPVGRGARMIDMGDMSLWRKRSLTNLVTKGLDIEGVPHALSARLLRKWVGVDYSPLKDFKQKKFETAADYATRLKRERADRLAEGIRPPPDAKVGSNNDGDTEIDPPDDTPESAAVSDADGLIKEIKEGAPDPLSPDFFDQLKAIRSSILTKTGGYALAVIGVLCAVNALGDQAEMLQYANIIEPMMRMATLYLASTSQTKAGAVPNSSEYGVYANDLANALNGTDATASAPFQKEVYGVDVTDPNLELNKDFRPDVVGKKPKLFQWLDQIYLLDRVCGVGDFINGIPVIKQIGQVQGVLLDTLLEGLFGVNSGDLLQGLVNFIAGSSINLYATGAELGNYLMYGARLTSNVIGMGVGGTELTADEATDLDARQRTAISSANSERGFYERYFDTANVDSFVSRAATGVPSSIKGLASTIVANPLGFMQRAIPKTSAATSYEFDYGVPEISYSYEEQNSDIAENPYENAATVETRIGDLDEKFGSCYPKRIDPDTLDVIENDDIERYDGLKSGCKKKPATDADAQTFNDDLLRYRLYLADRITESSLACFEGDSESCTDMGITTPPPSSESGEGGDGSTNINLPVLNGYAIPCNGPKKPAVVLTSGGTTRTDWTNIKDSGTIGVGSAGHPIKVYIREACDTSNPRTLLIVSSIHGSENAGQLIAHELLFNRNEQLPADTRVIVVPELNKYGIEFRTTTGSGGRVNARHVNLNRNADYRWYEMDGDYMSTSPFSTNYRGEAPNSEAEMQAITNFISSLSSQGNINLSIHYHDNLGYAASSATAAGLPFASIYSQITGLSDRNDNGETIIYQKGSVDGWQATTTGKPVLLVELTDDQSTPTIEKNVDAIISLLNNRSLPW